MVLLRVQLSLRTKLILFDLSCERTSGVSGREGAAGPIGKPAVPESSSEGKSAGL